MVFIYLTNIYESFPEIKSDEYLKDLRAEFLYKATSAACSDPILEEVLAKDGKLVYLYYFSEEGEILTSKPLIKFGIHNKSCNSL